MAPLGTIGSWSSTYLTKFLNDWLRRNPLPAQDQLTIKKLAVSDKLSFYGRPSTGQPTKAGNTTYTDSGTTVVHTGGTFTGGIGTTAYTVGDVVRALKTLGLLAP